MTASPSPPPWRAVVLALGVGALGGGLFAVLRLPLPWMLGAMTAVTALALSGRRPMIPASLRTVMLCVLGVMLGANFIPGLLARLPGWTPSLGGLVLFIAITPLLARQIFSRWGGMDGVTAYFSAAPGGINEMVTVGAAYGADQRQVALVHALRILIVVFTIPVWFRLSGAITGTGAPPDTPHGLEALTAFSLLDAGVLLGCAVVGYPLGRLLRLPAPPLVGPMLLSAAAHLSGVTALRPPYELVSLAQVVIGAGLGARFAGLRLADILPTSRQAVASALLMLGLAAAIAGIVSTLTGLPFVLLLLAYVPGGVAEMSLVSLALGLDVAFVATHHTLRIALVIMIAPWVFRRLHGRAPRT